MGLQQEGRRILEHFLRERMTRLDRLFFHSREERFFPSFEQLTHADIFLAQWERLVIAGAGALGIIAAVGIFWSFHNLTTIAAPAYGGSIKEVVVGEPQNINPLFASNDVDEALTNIFFLPLCATNGYTGPALADHCDLNETNTRADITLGDHAWHDEVPVTAQDVLFTIQTLQNEAVGSPWAALANKVTVTTDAQNHVVITAAHALPELTSLLRIGIIPEHIWKSVDPAHMHSSALNLKPVGSGPFQFENATADAGGFLQSLTLSAFQDFKPRPAYLQEITFRFALDTDTAKEMFSSRSVDAWLSFDPTDGDAVYKHDVKRYELTPPAVVSLFFNPSQNALFRNAHFRDAIALATDRTAIVKNALHSSGIPVRVPFPNSVLDDANLATLPDMNVDAARAELKKISFGNATTTLSLGVPAGTALEAVSAEIVKDFAAIGITVMPRAIDLPSAPTAAADTDLLLAGQLYPISNSVIPYWHSKGSAAEGVNYARYQMAEVDGWLESLQNEARSAPRAALLTKISNRIVADTPAVFLYQPVYEYFVSQKIHGIDLAPHTDAPDRFAHLTEWYSVTKQVKK